MDKRNRRSERNYRSQGYMPQKQDNNQQTPPPDTQNPHSNRQSIPPQFQYQPVVNPQQRNSQTQNTRQAYQSQQPQQVQRQYSNYQQNNPNVQQKPLKKPKKKMSKKTKIILIVVGVLFVIGIFASGLNNETTSSVPAPTAEVSDNHAVEPPTAEKTSNAYTLSELYEDYPSEAEASITDRIIEITGTVESVTGNYIYLDRESTLGYIICTMSEYSDDYSDLQKGDLVVIVGTVTGEFGHITVDDCFYIERLDNNVV